MRDTPPWHPSVPEWSPETLDVDPIERSETIPSSWYVDPAFHAWDRTAVFSTHWQYAGHIGQLREAGDYLTADAAGAPVVVVRGTDGALRAFYNVCRHRGGPLALDHCGRSAMLQCKYHGWTYRLDGSLRGVPRFNRVDLFDKKDYGLKPVRVATWEGLVFIHAGEPLLPLGDLLAGIAERIAPMRLEGLRFARRIRYEVACNWKVYVDNYLEGYHLPYVHPELCDVLDVGRYETETFSYYSLQYSPLSPDSTRYGAASDSAYYYFVFPNCMLNIMPGRLQMNIVLPLAPDRCVVLFDYFYTDTDSLAAARKIEEDMAFSDHVQQEDIEICEWVQRGLASPAYDRGRFSVECEQGVYHFQTQLKTAYRSAARAAGNAL
ncbi:MAG: aromatic ring-hydroxylating dioxygenase subunit alpha [Rhodothermales bacterium]|nr:aromatic ring-hydroxylating dioxygenase subunit alpha [Rhodothermales bacterium]